MKRSWGTWDINKKLNVHEMGSLREKRETWCWTVRKRNAETHFKLGERNKPTDSESWANSKEEKAHYSFQNFLHKNSNGTLWSCHKRTPAEHNTAQDSVWHTQDTQDTEQRALYRVWHTADTKGTEREPWTGSDTEETKGAEQRAVFSRPGSEMTSRMWIWTHNHLTICTKVNTKWMKPK